MATIFYFSMLFLERHFYINEMGLEKTIALIFLITLSYHF